VLAFLFAILVVFLHLGDLPLADPDEGRNAEVAREMAATGDWLVPSYIGLAYLDKPPAFFAAVGSSFAVFGVNEFAARIPSALSAIALLGVLWAFVRREYDGKTAACAVGVVATLPLFYVFARMVIFDMPLALFVSIAILAAFRAEASTGSARQGWYLASAAATGVATLIKGPVGFILPGLVLSVYGLVVRIPGRYRRLFHPANVAVFLGLVLPWFVATALRRPEFPHYGIVVESWQRFTTPALDRTGPWYYYIPTLIGACYPWSVLLPGLVVYGWRTRARWTPADKLLVTWALVVLVFFSLSHSKLPGYILTAAVAVGVLLARMVAEAFRRPGSDAGRGVFRGAVGFGIFNLVLVGWLAVEVARPGLWSELLGFYGRDYEKMQPLFGTLLVLVAVLGVLAVAAFLTRRVWVAFAAFTLLPALLLSVGFSRLEHYAEEGSSRGLAASIEQAAPAVRTLCVRCLPPGLAFYSRRLPILATEDGRETTSNFVRYTLARTETWPPDVVAAGLLPRWLETRSDTLFLLTRDSRKLEALAGPGARPLRLGRGWLGVVLPPGRGD